MGSRGRNSAAAASVVRIVPSERSRYTPPAFLKNKEEQELFTQLAATPHITFTDVPILALYVQAVFETQKLMRNPKCKPGEWERATRAALSLARSLRMTVQATVDPQVVGRKRKKMNNDTAAAMRNFRADDEDGEEDQDEE